MISNTKLRYPSIETTSSRCFPRLPILGFSGALIIAVQTSFSYYIQLLNWWPIKIINIYNILVLNFYNFRKIIVTFDRSSRLPWKFRWIRKKYARIKWNSFWWQNFSSVFSYFGFFFKFDKNFFLGNSVFST